MEFKLKKRRNITDTELIQDIQNVAKKLNKDTITIQEYNKLGQFNASTVIRRFGNWTKCLSTANLNFSKNDYSHIRKDDYIKDIQHVAKEYNLITLSAVEYDKYGKFHHRKIIREFKSWNNALKEAGLFNKISKNLSEEQLFDNLLNVWQKLGRQPYYQDMRKPLSICSAKPYVTKYGSWYKALENFTIYVNNDNETSIAEYIQPI